MLRAIWMFCRVKDVFQSVKRQVVAQLARDDIGQQSRPRQPLVDRLRGLRRGRDLRVVAVVFAPPAAVFVADVPQHLERRRQVFELLAHLLADPLAQLAAGRARLLGVSKIVLDVDPRQMVRQRPAAVLVPLRHAARDQFFARFLGDARLVQRHLVDLQAEQQELPRIEAFVPRAVKPPQEQGRRLLDGLGDGRLNRLVHGGLNLAA